MSSSEELGIISRIPHLCRFNSNAIAIPHPIESSGEDQNGKFSGTDTGTGSHFKELVTVPSISTAEVLVSTSSMSFFFMGKKDGQKGPKIVQFPN